MYLLWKVTKVDNMYNSTHPGINLAAIAINTWLAKSYSIGFSIVQNIWFLDHIVNTYNVRPICMIIKRRLVHFNWRRKNWPFYAVHFIYSNIARVKMIIHYMHLVSFLLLIQVLLSLVLYALLSILKWVFQIHNLIKIRIFL